MAMGMGGGKDSSGPQGLGAGAFGGEEGFNRISFYMDDIPAFQKTALNVRKSQAAKNAIEENRAAFLAFDPQGQYNHNPHLDSLETGKYGVGPVRYEQLYNAGLMNKAQYDMHNAWFNSKMPMVKGWTQDVKAFSKKSPLFSQGNPHFDTQEYGISGPLQNNMPNFYDSWMNFNPAVDLYTEV